MVQVNYTGLLFHLKYKYSQGVCTILGTPVLALPSTTCYPHAPPPSPSLLPQHPGSLLWSKSFLQGRHECFIQSQLGREKKAEVVRKSLAPQKCFGSA